MLSSRIGKNGCSTPEGAEDPLKPFDALERAGAGLAEL